MTAHEYIHEGIFEFEAGGSLTGLKVAYHTSEKPWQKGDSRKVIWLCHALTANSDAQDWWPELTGPGKLFDTDKYFVVCANMLGSPYGSSGPASENPSTGRPYLLDFPKITVRDIVRANSLVRKSLGIERIDLIVGGSIGGFQALEWSVMEPDVIGKAVFIALSAKTTPMAECCQRGNEDGTGSRCHIPRFRKPERRSGRTAVRKKHRHAALQEL